MKKIWFKIKLWFYSIFARKGLLNPKNIVCYVCGNEEFLPPLELEEELSLLAEKEEAEMVLMDLMEQWEKAQEAL